MIVGAGPAGLVLALQLARGGVEVVLLDMGKTVDYRPRAAHYASPAALELQKAGVLDDVKARGFQPDQFCWRRFNGEWIVGIDNRVVKDDPLRMVVLPLGMLGELLLEHAAKYPNITIHWSHEVVAIDQDDNKARAVARTEEGSERTFEGDYVVGCDGANSKVRRALFGDWNYPGKTWDEWVVATNVLRFCVALIQVYYPFEKFGYVDSNFIIDPEHWYMAAKITNDGLWRVSYGELPGLTPEEIIKRQPWKYQTMLPGNPTEKDYKLVNVSPYKMHQRCADRFRIGRFLLAADAAHLCNPFGGLGLTGGMVDAGNLADCLIGVSNGWIDESILDKYDEIRRKMWHETIDPISSANLQRMHPPNLDHVMEDPFFKELAKAEKDPEYMKEMVNVSLLF